MRTLPTSRPLRWVPALVLAVLLGATACGGSDEEADSPDSTEEPSAPTTAPTGDATTTTVAAEGPAEWVAVAQDLYERDFQLRAEPDPERVADLYAETCDCWDEQLSTVEFLVDNGEHFEGQAADVVYVEHEMTDPETGLVNLTVQGRTNPLRRVSSDGDVVQEIPADQLSCVAYAVLADGPDGAYRIYSATALPACPEGA